uniref:Uncharacterized protein n=1 Tax=Myotis lucifugus TaxID=59463 RepID=G1Q589_MYOLU
PLPAWPLSLETLSARIREPAARL